MATEFSPKSHQIEPSESQFDSQTSATIEQNFLAPLDDSQETVVTSKWHDDNGIEPNLLASPKGSQGIQGVTSRWRNDDSSHHTDGVNQPPQSTRGPLISRPLPEDPLNFQHGFQYSKAPIPHTLSAPLTALRIDAGRRRDSKDDIVIEVEHPSGCSGSQISDDPLVDSRDIRKIGAKAREPESKTSTKINDTVLISSDTSSDKISAVHEQQVRNIPRDSASRPPFLNTSPFNNAPAPFQQLKIRVRSPASRLEGSRLPKAFADIRRKALIQSSHTNCPKQSACHPSSPVGKASSRFNTPERDQDPFPNHEVSHNQTRQRREQPHRYPASNQSPHTPETQALGRKQPTNPSNAEEFTHSFTREVRKEYNLLTRPVSEASNITKKRTPRRQKPTRTRGRQGNLGMSESNARRYQLIQSWNDFFVYEAERNKHWEEKMNDIVEQLAERDERVVEYLAKIQEQEQIITNLELEKHEHHAKREEQELALNKLEERRQRLRERMKEYRDRLNEATIEQQSIFKYFQPRYHELREQMKQAELKHQESLKQALSTSSQVMDKIQKSVGEVRILSQQEIQKLRLEIKTLEVQLAERGKDVDREKECVNDLRRELEKSHELNRCSLMSLHTQNQELMKKSDMRTIQIQSVEQCINQQEQRIQSLRCFLEDDKANTQTPSELIEDLKALQKESLNSILSELREYVSSDREQSYKVTESLKLDIQGIHKLCVSLNEQIQSSQSASEWQEKLGKVQMEYQTLLWERDRLEEELAKMHNRAKTQREQQETLQQELDSLKASAVAADASDSLIKSLQEEKQKLQECLAEKEVFIHDLEDKLSGVNGALSAQGCRLKDQEQQFEVEREGLTKTIAACHEQQEQALKQARAECTKNRVEYGNIEHRLRGAQQDCSRLQKEIVQVKQRAESALKNSKDEAARQAQEILEPMVGLMDKVSEGLHASEQARGDLNARLEDWSNNQVGMSLLRQVVQKLAKDQKKTIENGKTLGKLLEVQKKLDSTWQWHKSEVDALNRAIALEKSVKADMERDSHGYKGKQVPEMLHVANRHVTIQSPGIGHDDDEKMASVSIEEERVTRRLATSLKGIMKPAVPQIEGGPEGQYYKTHLATIKRAGESSKRRLESSDAKSTLVSHSAYNRPVLGSSARLEGPAHDSVPENTETAFTETTASKKRKRAKVETDQRENAIEKMPQSAVRHRVKISDSMSSELHTINPEGPTTNAVQLQAQPWHLRGGPLEQRSRPFVTYGLMNLSTRGRLVDSIPATSSGGPRMSLLENPEPHVG
ncbi:hypothetical protein F5Y12DRAFT_795341 [Xylaria sp. FL1777]|nr:hypothetical protein F5Y12DRAFT_795341 [Xylaria sp. FL1777]